MKIGITFTLKQNDRWYKFGSKRYPGLGILQVQIPITNDYFITINAKVVNCDVPLLLSLYQITALRAVLYFDEGIIASKFGGWNFPLTRKFGHAYIERDAKILYTELELKRIHRHFMRSHPDKLVAMLRRAHHNSVTPKSQAKLEHIHRHCDVC